jgi:hypothetical protein
VLFNNVHTKVYKIGVFGFLYQKDKPSVILSCWTSQALKMEPIFCPETSAKDYHSTMHNTPEEHRSYKYRGKSPEIADNLKQFMAFLTSH